ncbi:MAG: hypothetical protein ACW99G_14520 [Candidatus Thorarchaeota archaeon]|jgi:hypothetical protein
MLNINLQNIEELVFLDRNLQREIPECKPLFDQWKLAQMTPSLKSMGKRAKLDLLNRLSEFEEILSGYFKTSITIDKLDYHIVKNLEFAIDDVQITDTEGYLDFSVSRIGEHLYISFWR